jgi:membrane-associated protein
VDWFVSAFKWVIHLLREPGAVLDWGGYAGIALVIFLETGALIFFLPGDSLLVVAGLYAAKGDFNILVLIALLIPAAIIGDACSYVIGSRLGTVFSRRHKPWLLTPERLDVAKRFYDKHGGKAIILARFAPLVRTFVPVVAGMVRMPYRRFASYNVIGGAAWVLSMCLTGYFLGTTFPAIGRHIEKVIIVVVFLSILPGIIEYLKTRKKSPEPPQPLA